MATSADVHVVTPCSFGFFCKRSARLREGIPRSGVVTPCSFGFFCKRGKTTTQASGNIRCHTLLFRVLLQTIDERDRVIPLFYWLSHPALSGSSANNTLRNPASINDLSSCHTLLFRVLLQMLPDQAEYRCHRIGLSHPALSGSSANDPCDKGSGTSDRVVTPCSFGFFCK